MRRDELQNFCREWLLAWTGNNPGRLIQFYAENALYLDPANKQGLTGRDQIFQYFKKLLAANPHWKWEATELYPTNLGFIVKWKATIATRGETITEYGMDIVEMEGERISRNEVYFDRSSLLEALKNQKKG
jgi:hypothetical protein